MYFAESPKVLQK